MEKMYTVSFDKDSGRWYAHMVRFAYVPVAGSFCEKKSDAMEYAKMCDGLPNRVEEIEERRRAEFDNEMGLEAGA